MGQYGRAAKKAAHRIIKSNQEHLSAWTMSIREETDSLGSQLKVCPRSAFLGLVLKTAKINGRINKDAQYALTALDILKNNPDKNYTATSLWNSFKHDAISEQGQMDVLLALWNDPILKKHFLK